VNLLGVDDQNDFVRGLAQVLVSHPQAKVHTYGKGARKGRKMGHVTVVSDDAAFAVAECHATVAALLDA